jgi:hypothetical protein
MRVTKRLNLLHVPYLIQADELEVASADGSRAPVQVEQDKLIDSVKVMIAK